MKKVRTRQQNFRMSDASIRVLADTAAATGLSKTQVLELCLARHAQSLPNLVEQVRRELAQVVTAHFGEHAGKQQMTGATMTRHHDGASIRGKHAREVSIPRTTRSRK